jgi:hypothetical protein
MQLEVVAHTCNPNYSGGGDRKITKLMTSWAKSSKHKVKAGCGVTLYNPSYPEGLDWEDCGSMPVWVKS